MSVQSCTGLSVRQRQVPPRYFGGSSRSQQQQLAPGHSIRQTARLIALQRLRRSFSEASEELLSRTGDCWPELCDLPAVSEEEPAPSGMLYPLPKWNAGSLSDDAADPADLWLLGAAAASLGAAEEAGVAGAAGFESLRAGIGVAGEAGSGVVVLGGDTGGAGDLGLGTGEDGGTGAATGAGALGMATGDDEGAGAATGAGDLGEAAGEDGRTGAALGAGGLGEAAGEAGGTGATLGPAAGNAATLGSEEAAAASRGFSDGRGLFGFMLLTKFIGRPQRGL